RNAAPPETRLIIGNDPMVPRQREEGAKPGQPSVYAQAGAMQKQQRRAPTGLEYECADADKVESAGRGRRRQTVHQAARSKTPVPNVRWRELGVTRRPIRSIDTLRRSARSTRLQRPHRFVLVPSRRKLAPSSRVSRASRRAIFATSKRH